MYRYTTIVFFFVIFATCDNERARLAKVPVNVEVQRFERDMFAIDEANFDTTVANLQVKYGDFFTLFCDKIIAAGTPDSLNFKNKIFEFLHDTVVCSGYRRSQEVFAESGDMNETFTLAFKRFRVNFPKEKIPQIYTYVSGFNHSVTLTDSVLAIGIDKYLGSDYPLYLQMGFYRYLARNMYPAKMFSDAMHYFAEAMFPARCVTLLQKMIWEGKLFYFTRQMLPEQPDSCIFGFSQEQIKSCLNNEAYMWSVLVENQLLFSQNQRDIRSMTEDAPFTLRFSQEAPGKAANWIGYRIVEQYMRKRSDVTLSQLMQNDDAQTILEQSQYNPR